MDARKGSSVDKGNRQQIYYTVYMNRGKHFIYEGYLQQKQCLSKLTIRGHFIVQESAAQLIISVCVCVCVCVCMSVCKTGTWWQKNGPIKGNIFSNC